jgi:hypothetical protein
MAKVGRPTKLTPDVEQKILLAVRGGNYRYVAARWAGTTERALQRWMLEGKKHPKSKYGKFRKALIEAEQTAEIHAIKIVLDAAKKDAKHAQWWLERKQPARWGRQAVQKHELSGPGGRPVEVNAEVKDHVPDPARVLAVLAILRSAGAAPLDDAAGGGADCADPTAVRPPRPD